MRESEREKERVSETECVIAGSRLDVAWKEEKRKSWEKKEFTVTNQLLPNEGGGGGGRANGRVVGC